jgi:hypothetical protein
VPRAPFDREDIYRLASRLDDVMDFFEAAGDLIVLTDLEVLPLEMLRITEILVRGAELTAAAMPQKTVGVITLALVVTHHLSAFKVPLWVKLLCAVAISAGTASGGAPSVAECSSSTTHPRLLRSPWRRACCSRLHTCTRHRFRRRM